MSKHDKLTALLDEFGPVMRESAGERAKTPPRPRLVPVPDPESKGKSRVREGEYDAIPLEQIVADEQYRKVFDEQTIRELAASILAVGLIEPIVVRWDQTRELFVIVSGERRFRAAKLAKLSSIPALIRQLNDIQVAEIQLAENVSREDLNPIDQARAFHDVMQKTGRSARALAKRVGVDPSTITRTVRLLRLPDDVQRQITAGEVTAGAGRELARIEDPKTQRVLLAKVKADNLNARQTEALVQRVLGKKKTVKEKVRTTSSRSPASQQLTFDTDHGPVVVFPEPNATYDDVLEALKEAGKEVQHRIKNRVVLNLARQSF